MADWTVRRCVPAAYTASGRPDTAERLAGLPPVRSYNQLDRALAVLIDGLPKAKLGSSLSGLVVRATTLVGELLDSAVTGAVLLRRLEADCARCAHHAMSLGVIADDVAAVASWDRATDDAG
jgi:hypothetical protein